MKLKFSKLSSAITSTSRSKNAALIASVNDMKVVVKMVHTGTVLSVDEVNKNRSSKYTYLVF